MNSKVSAYQLDRFGRESMRYAIAVDSSSDIMSPEELNLSNDDIALGVAPLTIVAGGREFPDVPSTSVEEMVDFLETLHEKSGTACPSTGEWLAAFREATEVFGIAITSKLSGSYDSGVIAKETYEKEHPGRRVHIVDSLSTGPQMWLMAEKLRDLMREGPPFERIREEIELYRERTQLIFSLESLKNLANNGRVSPAVAKITSILGIRVVGRATEGTLDPFAKARGEKKALAAIVKEMHEKGFAGGKVNISHVLNEQAALKLKAMIEEKWANAQVRTYPTRVLTSFYAERGGLLVGYEIASA
ncbi:MAG: DegV family protein [Eggerthellaceae bacterium]|nr:DegV family protein [Eggerthellaceae bacterium]